MKYEVFSSQLIGNIAIYSITQSQEQVWFLFQYFFNIYISERRHKFYVGYNYEQELNEKGQKGKCKNSAWGAQKKKKRNK